MHDPSSVTIERTTCRLPSDAVVVIEDGSVSLPGGHDTGVMLLPFPRLVLLEEAASASTWEEAARRAASRLDTAGVAHGPLRQMAGTMAERGIDPGRIQPGLGPDERNAIETGSDHGVPDGLLELVTPKAWVLSRGGFVHRDHDGGAPIVLSAAALAFVTAFATASTFDDALAAHRRQTGGLALEVTAAEAVVRALVTQRLLLPTEPGATKQAKRQRQAAAVAARARHTIEVADALAADHDRAEAERVRQGAAVRVPVVPVQRAGGPAPLGLGLLLSYAQVHDGGRLVEHYDLFGRWAARHDLVAATRHPGVFCFSNYLWSHEDNLAASREVKEASPTSITVHGGPDTPKYPGDVQRYFAANPHVDIAVHGEGEVTFAEMLDALIGQVGEEPCDLSVLADVPGLSYRATDGTVRTTGSRDRLAELDILPSPYLNGMFDAYGQAGLDWAILETNRGCPYGCTFCDWGSATTSRIRKFDLERVFAEFEWCATHRVERIFMADANFGIFARDVDIVRKVAELKTEHGYPQRFFTNYAKNTVKHLKPIVEAMAGAGILTEGLLSLQSMDEDTLQTINRSNIKTEKYDDLAGEFHRAGLPLFVDLMVGLPGATTTSFVEDLQKCIDREVAAKVFPTDLLVNSPMNHPDYRREHAIETAGSLAQLDAGVTRAERTSLVVSSSSFTRDDYHTMLRSRRVFLLCENFGVLRQVARVVRQETGMREIDLYERISADARRDPARWPCIAFTLDALPTYMAPPVSWRYFIDEVHDYLVEELGLVDDGALACVLQVQHALLPARGRELPTMVPLDHDYVAWHHAVVQAKHAGHRLDWPDHVARLATFGPGTLAIADDGQVCSLNLGFNMDVDDYSHWELASAVTRPMPSHHVAGT